MKVKYNTVTQSAATITKLYGKQKDGTYHTGVDIIATSVYSICDCVVTDIRKDSDGTYTVTCQYDTERAVRYSNLVTVDVSLRQPVKYKSVIGSADGHVHFEYLELSSRNTFPVRVRATTFFKVDPIDVITNDGTKAFGSGAVKDLALHNHPNPQGLPIGMLEEMLGPGGDETWL